MALIFSWAWATDNLWVWQLKQIWKQSDTNHALFQFKIAYWFKVFFDVNSENTDTQKEENKTSYNLII